MANEAATPSHRRRVVVASLIPAVAITGWLVWRDIEGRRADGIRQQMVQAGREGLLALTTIDHQQVDADVQRILNASTGSFRDDFEQRAQGFKDAARKARSTSVGKVTEAGVESVDGDLGRVLVALTVMTSNRGIPEQQPKAWRTRVTLSRGDGGFKVAAVEFIP